LGDKLGDKKEDKLGDKQGDKGAKTSGRRTHHPTQAHMWGDNGRQGETRPLQGGCDPRRRHHPDTPSRTGIDVEIMGNNGTQPETRGDGETGRGTMEDKWRQDLGVADKPSNTGAHVRRQWETRGNKTSGRQAHHPTKGQEGRWETRGNKTSGRRTHHPTQADKGRQDREGRTHHPRQRHHPTQVHMWGHKGRQDIGKADTPSNTGMRHTYLKQDFGKVNQPTQAHMSGDNGRQWETTGHKDRQEGRQ